MKFQLKMSLLSVVLIASVVGCGSNNERSPSLPSVTPVADKKVGCTERGEDCDESDVTSNGEPHASAKDGQPDMKLIPRRIFFGNPDRAGVQLSSDGKHLSFISPLDGVMNVWVAPVDDLDAARPVTNDKHRGVRSYFWAFTNEHILYSKDNDGDENWRVYCVNLNNDEVRDITPGAKPDEAAPSQEADAEEAKAKPAVAARIQGVSHRQPEEILVGVNDRDPRWHDIYRVNILSGESSLVQENDGYRNFTVDEDYNVRFAAKYLADGGIQYYQPAAEGSGPEGITEWKDFLKVEREDTANTGIGGFDKTGQVVYLIDSRGRDTGALTSLDLKTGESKVIASDPRTDAGAIKWHPTENTVQAVSFNYERRERKIFDPEVAKDIELLGEVSSGELGIADYTLDDRKWIVVFSKDDGPVRYYLFDRDTKKSRFLFVNRQNIEGLPLAKMHSAVIPARDGLNLVSYYTLPRSVDPEGDGTASKPLPMVLLVHGGPWSRDTWGYDSLHQLLANRGYAVLSVNFRGSTGFGKNFLNAGNHEWAGKMHDDLLDAVDWAVDKGIAQRDKLCIMGGSYGGYATLVGLTFTPDVFACGVDIVGPSNIVTLLNTIPPYWASGLQMFKNRVGDHTTEEGRAELEKRSPLNFVEKIRRPLLIGQGANDPRVKQSEADQIVSAMEKHNIPVAYVLFPDEGHGFVRPENRLAFYAATEAFLARHLGGQAEPIGDALEGSSIQVPTGSDQLDGVDEALSAAAE